MAEFLGTRRNGTVYFKFILFYSHQWPFYKNGDIIQIIWKFWLFLANFCKMAEFLATRRIGTLYFLFILFYARQWAFYRNGEIIPTKWKFCLFLQVFGLFLQNGWIFRNKKGWYIILHIYLILRPSMTFLQKYWNYIIIMKKLAVFGLFLQNGWIFRYTSYLCYSTPIFTYILKL